MKINQRLEKFVKLAIQTQNFEARKHYETELADARRKALMPILPQLKRRKLLERQRAKAIKQLAELDNELMQRGYAISSRYSDEPGEIVANDLTKLGVPHPQLKQLSENTVLTNLLKASDAEGAKILKSIGVVQ